MALPDPLTDPVALAVVTLLLYTAVKWQRGLSWPEYRAIHRAKVRWFPLLQKYSPGGFDSFVNVKGYHDDAEYLTTRPESVKTVWRALVNAGGSPHLISSVKRREHPEKGTQYAKAHVVWIHPDDSQTEAYIFAGGDVYAHHEPAVTDPEEHVDGPQTDGDPRGVVHDALGI